MRWSGHRGWFEPAPKQPVPEDGLRVDRFGTTWWGSQWIGALHQLGAAYRNRLPRGRSYARAGRVVGLAMGAGEITAEVVGTRRRPYEVTIGLKTFGKERWETIVEVLADRARFTVALLRGELPAVAGEALEARGIGLFPTRGELSTSCSCPDWANPCKHVAAVHYVVAAALDMDPFLIFVLRGLGRDRLLAALAEARGLSVPPGRKTEAPPREAPWEEPGPMTPEEFLGQGLPRPGLAFRIEPATVDLAGLARLGPPPPALDDIPRRLGAGIRRAARAAVALAGAAEPPRPELDAGDATGVRDAVLTLIGRHPEGVSMRLLASRLPFARAEIQSAVMEMRREGLLESRGRGAGTRYVLLHEAAGTPGTAQQKRTSARATAQRAHGPGSERQTKPRKSRAARTRDDLPALILKVMPRGTSMTLREIAGLLDRPVDSALRTAMRTLRIEGKVTMTGIRRSARYIRN